MDTQTIVVPTGGDVSGNITSCRIENQLVNVTRAGPWSLTEYNSYITYDVCSKKIISTYQLDSISGFGSLIVVLGIVLAVIFVFFAAAFAAAMSS